MVFSNADLFTAKTKKLDSLSTELQPVVAIAKMLCRKPATLLELGERGSVCLKAFSRRRGASRVLAHIAKGARQRSARSLNVRRSNAGGPRTRTHANVPSH
jgi:hypothetical protein